MPPSPPCAQTLDSANSQPLSSQNCRTIFVLCLSVGEEGVQGNHDRHAVLLQVLDVLLQVDDALFASASRFSAVRVFLRNCRRYT